MKRKIKASTIFIIIAILGSVVVLVIGQGFMWNLYSQSQAPAAKEIHYTGKPLVIGVARTPGGPEEWIAYAQVFSELEKKLERPVEVKYALDQNEMPQMLLDGKVDIAFVTKTHYLLMQNKNEVKLVAAPIVDGNKYDCALIVVKGDSPFVSIDDLRDKKILLAQKHSIGAYSYLYWLFNQRGENPQTFFSKIITTQAEDQSLTRLHKGEADAACVNRFSLARWPEDTFSIISQSPEYAMPPIVARNDLDPRIVEDIQTALLSMTHGREIPQSSKLTGFYVPEESDYAFARTLLDFIPKTSIDPSLKVDE